MKTDLPPLRPLRDDEFLPPVSRWMRLGGFVLMGSVASSIALAALLPYNVTVKAPATVRPSGELRLVQANRDGTIVRIEVAVNQVVRQGQVIAQLDTTLLESQRQQLRGSLQQAQIQLTQMAAQIGLIATQITAETRSSDRSVDIAQAELNLSQQGYQQQQATAQADLAEAEAALVFAQREMQRYQQLVNSGAISQLQLEEKQAAVQTAAAQVARARAALAPSAATVTIAQERIAQEESRRRATLATLNREREALLQQQAALQAQLGREQAELQRIETELQQSVIQATSDGILFQLNLRNPNQVVRSGEILAEIAPDQEAFVIKAAVNPPDINKLTPGQTAYLRLEACPFSDYGTLQGRVTAIAPDATSTPVGDRASTPTTPPLSENPRYFEVTIQPTTLTLPHLTQPQQTCPLQAGMNAEANIVTRQETVLQFILRKARLLLG